MFTPAEREAIRTQILERAKRDERLSGGAITGSSSMGNEDDWSDIDLAFGVRNEVGFDETLADYTLFMEQNFSVVEHFDVWTGAWVYRVFLLSSTLQVDLAFAPESDFGARAPSFRIQFGKAADLSGPLRPPVDEIIGYAWLYALHARSSLARERFWQAEYFVGAMRNQALILACIRLGLPHRDGRGYDRLPNDVLGPLRRAFAPSLEAASIRRAFQTTSRALLSEIEHLDSGRALRLGPVLRDLAAIPPSH